MYKNLIDRSFLLVLYLCPLTWLVMKQSLKKHFVLWILLKNAFFQALRALRLEKCIFEPKNRFCQKIFDVSLGCMGASKRCFGVRGCLGIYLESLEAIWKHLEQIEKNSKFLFFEKCFHMASNHSKWVPKHPQDPKTSFGSPHAP